MDISCYWSVHVAVSDGESGSGLGDVEEIGSEMSRKAVRSAVKVAHWGERLRIVAEDI